MPLAIQKGGAEKSLVNLLFQNEIERQFTPVVVFFENGPLVELLKTKTTAKIYVVETKRLSNIPSYFRAVIKIRKIFIWEKCDILLSWMTKAHFYGAIVAFLTRKPNIWYQHGFASKKSFLELIAAALPANGIFTCSKAGKLLQRELSPKSRINVQYEFIDIDEIKKADSYSTKPLKEKLAIPQGKKIIGFVGRLQRWKGAHYLLQALPEILKHSPDAICLIVGGTHNTEIEYEEELRQLVRKLKIEKNAIFCGQQSNPLEWMKTMDVFVHTSNSEPLGMVIIEAMALGKPVICTPHGGPSEIVRDGKTGLFCEPINIVLLSKKISLLLNDDKLAKRIGSLGQAYARDYIRRNTAKGFIDNINLLLKK